MCNEKGVFKTSVDDNGNEDSEYVGSLCTPVGA
jgi:hypothetical protein